MFDNRAKNRLKAILGQWIVFNEPMAKHTTFKIGGPADGLAAPQSLEQLKALVQWAQQNNTAYMILGGGTNLLVREGGIRGLVIRLDQLAGQVTWKVNASRVEVTAGVGIPTKRLCALSLKHGWQGMNFALGIPGSLGGAIKMNAGTVHGALADVLAAVTVLSADGQQRRLGAQLLKMTYRQMRLPEAIQESAFAPTIIMTAEVILKKANRQEIRREARQMMQARAAAQPIWQPSAGCFFKNPSARKPAGRLIDQAGLKGIRIGDAQVANRHANFIINKGRATATDVLALVEKIQNRVYKQFGIELATEVRIVGEQAST